MNRSLVRAQAGPPNRRLAQLVQSISFTPRGSGVRVPHLPQTSRYSTTVSASACQAEDVSSILIICSLFLGRPIFIIKVGRPMRNREKKEKQCLNCGNDIPNRNVYCNNKCQSEYELKQSFKLLEEGKFEELGRMDTIDSLSKKYLIHKNGNECMKCGWNEVNPHTGRVPIQLNHIDGNPENHSLDNVELLCPNCHSLTEYFGRRGKGRKWRYMK